MKQLLSLSEKKVKKVVGLMSGTSADGVDAVLAEIKNSGKSTKIKQLSFLTFPYSARLKNYILKNSDEKSASLEDITRLNVLLGEYFADAALKIIKISGHKSRDIDLIGSHGQTIAHFPKKKKMFDKNIRATLQIGDPTIISKRTGIVTVGDFRIADIAVGGSGAPLVPYFDYIMLRSKKYNRGLLNIGGISNITVIPKKCDLKNIFAFDTGPGNMLIDILMQKLFHKGYDDHGQTAYKGKINTSLLRSMMSHKYLKQDFPKSTGREMFGDKYSELILKRSEKILKLDILTTVSEFTALTIYDAYLKFISPRVTLDEIFVSGGGVHNPYLLNSLSKYFNKIKIKRIEKIGFSSDAKEAVCFAVLANETVSGNCANVVGATGAKYETILGKICLP